MLPRVQLELLKPHCGDGDRRLDVVRDRMAKLCRCRLSDGVRSTRWTATSSFRPTIGSDDPTGAPVKRWERISLVDTLEFGFGGRRGYHCKHGLGFVEIGQLGIFVGRHAYISTSGQVGFIAAEREGLVRSSMTWLRRREREDLLVYCSIPDKVGVLLAG